MDGGERETVWRLLDILEPRKRQLSPDSIKGLEAMRRYVGRPPAALPAPPQISVGGKARTYSGSDVRTGTLMKGAPMEDAIAVLARLNVGGVLKQVAQRGQLLEIRCEMPKCYCPNGRRYFEPKSHPPRQWALSADHYPRLKKDGGKLEPGNVRLAHVLCNREDYGWRVRITKMMSDGRSLHEIASELNRKGVRTPHGSAKWTPGSVRKAFVS